MNKSHKNSYTTAIGLLAAGLIVSFSSNANAQVGSGWTQVGHSERLISAKDGVVTTTTPLPSSFDNGGCSFSNSGGIKTFTLYNTSSNRCEIVVSGDYESGSHQVQADVKVLTPTNDESAIQIKAQAPGTSQLLRSYSTAGGRLGVGGTHPLIDGIYGVWVRINYIHDLDRNSTTWYANGTLKYSQGSGAIANYTTHYGIYGTLGASSGTHQFKNVTFYDGGSASSQPAVPVSLSSSFNRSNGIVNDGTTFTGGLDGGGAAYSANLLGGSVTVNSVSFNFGPANAADTVSCVGQTISLPAGNFATLQFVGTGINGNKPSQSFVVRYTDGTSSTFTQSLSDWFTPQNYAGETTAKTMTYRNVSNGSKDNRTFYLYAYSFAIASGKTVSGVTLPNNASVEILAVTLR